VKEEVAVKALHAGKVAARTTAVQVLRGSVGGGNCKKQGGNHAKALEKKMQQKGLPSWLGSGGYLRSEVLIVCTNSYQK
jgi:hypothetical protein